jgi:tetratricopeptide (TPR) repeat protein
MIWKSDEILRWRWINRLLFGFGFAASLCAPLVGGLLGHAARADEILAGEQAIHRAEVVGYAAGQVEYRATDGKHAKMPVWVIDYLVIDSVANVADFNEAEEYLVKDQAAQAVGRYERALRGSSGYMADLAQVRLLMAADRAGAFEKAVRAFLTLTEKDPVAAANLFPESLPVEMSSASARNIAKIESVLADPAARGDRSLVEYLLYEARRKQTDTPVPALANLAEAVAITQLPAELMTVRTAKVKAAAMEALMLAGRAEEIIAAIDASLVDLPVDLIPEFLLLKSRAMLSGAETYEGWMEAALPAMRAAIHYADTPAAGEGLLLAAEAHEKAGLVDDATRLLRRCLRLDSATENAKDRARQTLARLAAAGDD